MRHLQILIIILIISLMGAIAITSFIEKTFNEPITHSCNINGESFPFEYKTCEQVCNAVDGRFYVSVMTAPNFVNGCEING